jgi:hypothetical protein
MGTERTRMHPRIMSLDDADAVEKWIRSFP